MVHNGFNEAFNIAFTLGPLVIHHNTIVGGSGIFTQGDSVVTIANNIVVHARRAVSASGGELTVDCNDLWDNLSNYEGVTPGANDFSAEKRLGPMKWGCVSSSATEGRVEMWRGGVG